MRRPEVSRRQFIGWLIAIPFLYGWFRISRQKREHEEKAGIYTYRGDVAEGITFAGPVILSKQDGHIRIFSSSCTHLGCTINRTENGQIVCPCHGSVYDINGLNRKGPSRQPLRELEYSVNSDKSFSIRL
jgi:Rieske Fe-S protein